MLRRLAQLAITRPKLVLVVTVGLLVAAFAYGGNVADRLAGGGYLSETSESSRAADLLSERFNAGKPNVVILATNTTGASIDQPEAVAAGLDVTRQLAETPGVDAVQSYWSTGGSPQLRSRDGSQALILAHATGDERAFDKVARHLIETHRGSQHGPLQLELGGEAISYVDVTTQTSKDVATSELIAMPVILLLLILVFGSLVAAGLPLLIGICSIIGTLGLLALLTHVTPVSNFALNLTTILGLGLAVDYSLFVVSRFREERNAGRDLDEAIRISVCTAGHTVVFSAVTVTLAMLAMLVFPLMGLRSIAYACVGVVTIAALGAVVLLPALLKLLGHRIDALDLRRMLRRRSVGRHRAQPGLEDGFWFRSSATVMRRPVLIGGAVLVVLLLLGAPFANIHIGITDDRVVPATVESRHVGDTIRNEFPAQPTGTMDVVFDGPVDVPELPGYVRTLSQLPHVVTVTEAPGFLTVVPDVDPYSAEAEQLLERIRTTPAPGAVLVGGLTAENVDTKDALAERIPLAATIIVVTMFVLLFAFTRSVVLPLKALVLNVLSLSATLGAMVFIFQEGHLKWLVGDFTATGSLSALSPVLMFCLTFGLSMDYEVFLLSRITEEYRVHGDTNAAVRYGLQRVGPIVTAAAVIMSVVCVALATSQVSFTKMLGVGLTLAILVDATLIRALLMPAAMRLMGRANWWAPQLPNRKAKATPVASAAHDAVVPAMAGRRP